MSSDRKKFLLQCFYCCMLWHSGRHTKNHMSTTSMSISQKKICTVSPDSMTSIKAIISLENYCIYTDGETVVYIK